MRWGMCKVARLAGLMHEYGEKKNKPRYLQISHAHCMGEYPCVAPVGSSFASHLPLPACSMWWWEKKPKGRGERRALSLHFLHQTAPGSPVPLVSSSILRQQQEGWKKVSLRTWEQLAFSSADSLRPNEIFKLLGSCCNISDWRK